ncbi:pentapeptide repeat-containing protein [Streptomyces sp. NPDC051773]|uniref:pentapeptide repeat-containing protein n=1 Tax=Streptomyces sp. NPDC051773 TaxID=3156682 RepID=UPI00342B1E2F
MVTQRFTAAVAQLGDKSLDVRLGGIYGLQRIMNDSQKDQPAVVRVLCAYVRTRAHTSTGKSKNVQIADLPKASEDVVAAAQVLAARNTKKEGPNEIDWSGAYLVGVDVHVAKLDGAFLTKTVLRGAMLEGASIRGAFLQGADLSSANMSFSDFDSTLLNDADLRHAYLRSASLWGAKLIGADLRDADLEGADLRDANFRGANLSTATGLTPEQLEEAGIFSNTQLPSNVAQDRRIRARIRACEAGSEECAGAIAEG